jgi:hypothetical protein
VSDYLKGDLAQRAIDLLLVLLAGAFLLIGATVGLIAGYLIWGGA